MIDKQFIGYEVPPTLWDVEKGRIRFFAEVIGATDPIYFDASAAQAAGYRDVVAPPTFIFGAESDSGVLMTLLDTLKIDLRKVLHGEQRIDYHAPVCAGDTLRFQTRVTDIYDKKGGALWFVVQEMEMKDQTGKLLAKGRGVTVVRNPDAAKK